MEELSSLISEHSIPGVVGGNKDVFPFQLQALGQSCRNFVQRLCWSRIPERKNLCEFFHWRRQKKVNLFLGLDGTDTLALVAHVTFLGFFLPGENLLALFYVDKGPREIVAIADAL